MLLPNNTNIKFDASDNFTNSSIDDNDNAIINKNIYNYSSTDMLNELSQEDKNKIIKYYNIINKKSDLTLLDDELEKFCDDNMFNYEQWEIFRKYIIYFQEYLKNNFIKEYNYFINNILNPIFLNQTNNYNDIIKKINYIYLNNISIENKQAFKGIDINNFSDEYKNILNSYYDKIQSNIYRLKISKKLPEAVEKAHIIKIK